MNDSSRNTRTLIVSFVVSLMVLVPLRFVEVAQQNVPSPFFESEMVLGETVQVENVLPVLESPYNQLETIVQSEKNCFTVEEANERMIMLEDRLLEELPEDEYRSVLEEMESVAICE